MKRKTLTLVLCLLATFALASIGFASWIITNPDISGSETTGNFTVYDTETKEISASVIVDKDVSDETKKGYFIFGKPSTYSPTSSQWLTAGSDVKEEKLTVTLDITIGNANLLNGGSIDVVFYLDTNTLPTAITNGYLTFKINNETVTFKTDIMDGKYACKLTLKPTINSGSTDGTATVTLEFGWGAKFGYINPYNYYSDKAYASYSGEAKTNLVALEEAVTNLDFKVKISKSA